MTEPRRHNISGYKPSPTKVEKLENHIRDLEAEVVRLRERGDNLAVRLIETVCVAEHLTSEEAEALYHRILSSEAYRTGLEKLCRIAEGSNV